MKDTRQDAESDTKESDTMSEPHAPSTAASLDLDADSTPEAARLAFRGGLVRPTCGIAKGYAQANLMILPKELAFDFLLFAQRNPKPCPLLEVMEAGVTEPATCPGADIRTDVPLYRVWDHGELVAETTDITDYWRDDLVTFVIGCSFTFEFPLMEAGVPVRHITAGRNVPMYDTSIPCASAGRFHSTMVVSMRGIPSRQVSDAVRISGYYPSVHGAPVCVGDPEAIGIDDLDHPDYGDAPILEEGDIPVFWACGVTPQAAVMASRPAFAITHAPGHMLITSKRDLDYMV
ncbi:hypothetical protein BCAL_1766 [Bifidobacterium callitrichos DSM 23973]|nr:hypothetical protein BCAL_1766 [Bifidobacterium callitrichos DSM 23973]